MSIKYPNDTIGNRTCDLPACSAVPQPTAPPRAPNAVHTFNIHFSEYKIYIQFDDYLRHFFSIYVIYKCGRGPHNTNWRAAGLVPLIYIKSFN